MKDWWRHRLAHPGRWERAHLYISWFWLTLMLQYAVDFCRTVHWVFAVCAAVNLLMALLHMWCSSRWASVVTLKQDHRDMFMFNKGVESFISHLSECATCRQNLATGEAATPEHIH